MSSYVKPLNSSKSPIRILCWTQQLKHHHYQLQLHLSITPKDQNVPSILVKLRPVQTKSSNANGNKSNESSGNPVTTTSNTNIVFNTLINNLNQTSGNNNSNNSSSSYFVNTNNNNTNQKSNKDNNNFVSNENNSSTIVINNQKSDERPDKRASVRELAQMMFEESKVRIIFLKKYILIFKSGVLSFGKLLSEYYVI